jgi:pre-mRNA-processing factor 39
LQNKGNTEKASEMLQKALESDPDNPKVHLQLLDLQFQSYPLNEANIVGIMRKAIKSNMPLENKVMFSQRLLDFLEDFGSDVAKYVCFLHAWVVLQLL